MEAERRYANAKPQAILKETARALLSELNDDICEHETVRTVLKDLRNYHREVVRVQRNGVESGYYEGRSDDVMV